MSLSQHYIHLQEQHIPPPEVRRSAIPTTKRQRKEEEQDNQTSRKNFGCSKNNGQHHITSKSLKKNQEMNEMSRKTHTLREIAVLPLVNLAPAKKNLNQNLNHHQKQNLL